MLHIASYTHPQSCGLGDVQIHICPDIVAVEFGGCIIFESIVPCHYAVFVIVGGGEGVSENLGTSADREVGPGGEGTVLCDYIQPVGVRIKVRVVAVICLENLVLGERLLVRVRLEIVQQVHILCSTDELRQFGRSLNGLLHSQIH